MEKSTLKLIVRQGPSEGITMECKPGKQIRIGRVVRGNTLTIKDSGISQKHLTVNFEGGRWTVVDLDSSNGTFVNGDPIAVVEGHGLRDGDVIKIGEWTSMDVRIEGVGEAAAVEESRPRRVTRRGAAAAAAEAASVSVSERPVTRARAKCEAGDGRGGNIEEASVKGSVAGVVGRRRGLRSEARASKEEPLKEDERVMVPKELNVETEKEGTVGRRRGRGRGRGRGGRKKGPMASVAESIVEKPNVVDDGSQKMEFEGRIAIKTEPVDSIMEEPVVEPQSLPERLDLGNLDSVPEANAAPENEKNGVIEVGSSSRGNVEGEFDIEKLTVGEWIDRMEKYLPRKINEIADEVILSMRQRAQQYNEFVAEQRRLGNMKLG